MTLTRRLLMAWLLLLPAAWVQATPTPAQESARIEGLIASVQQLKGAVFIRNGEQHSAAAAADHLRLKWKNAGSRVRTAEDFIRVCATGSSMTGRKYRIRFGDGRTQDSADYFRAQLRRIDAGRAAARPSASEPG